MPVGQHDRLHLGPERGEQGIAVFVEPPFDADCLPGTDVQHFLAARPLPNRRMHCPAPVLGRGNQLAGLALQVELTQRRQFAEMLAVEHQRLVVDDVQPLGFCLPFARERVPDLHAVSKAGHAFLWRDRRQAQHAAPVELVGVTGVEMPIDLARHRPAIDFVDRGIARLGAELDHPGCVVLIDPGDTLDRVILQRPEDFADYHLHPIGRLDAIE